LGLNKYVNNNILTDTVNFAPMFDTAAFSDNKYKMAGTNVAVPSPAAVVDAKEWVESNHK
jgi:hypothetical protein